MATCCGSNGTPFIQTRFLGASVMRFSATCDWNGTGGSLQVELAEDLCSGDAFAPPGIGEPVSFEMGGFTYGGILQNWKQNDSASDAKAYTVNVISPRDIVEGYQLILSSYNGPYMGVPNLGNVYGWLEATLGAPCAESGFNGGVLPSFGANLTYPPAPGYGGAFNNEVGIPWQLIRTAMHALLNGGGGAYGAPMQFRGHTYYFDMSELPLLNGDIRIGGESMSVEDMVARVCSLAGVDYFYELITAGATCEGGGTVNIIRVRTSDSFLDESAELVDAACSSQIDARLSLGTIGSAIQSSECIHRYGRGLELKIDVTNAFLTGEFRQDLWQIAYEGDCDGYSDTIWPYWGKNPNGSIILGTGCSDHSLPDVDDLEHGHNFWIDTSELNIGIDAWRVTLFELQAALIGEQEWEYWLWEKEPTKYAETRGLSEISVRKKYGTEAGKRMWAAFEYHKDPDRSGMKVSDIRPIEVQEMRDFGSENEDTMKKCKKLYNYVRKYAQEFYGRKFMVKLPFLCKRYNPDTPWTWETNWQNTDSAWTEWPVLGIPNNHWILDQFRADDGKIKCMMKFQSTMPMLLDNLSKNDFFALDLYNILLSATSQEIVWVTPTDARAVVELSGPVQQHSIYNLRPEWIMYFAMMDGYHGKDVEKFKDKVRNLALDRIIVPMHEPFLMPVAAAVPLQSTRLVYGPWFAKKSDVPGYDFFGGGALFGGTDKGRTEYQRESGFAPWHFGNFNLMNLVAYNTASAMLGEKYVVEMGDITFPGAPTGSIGDRLSAGGPTVSHIDVQVGRGSGAVLTTYRMKTYTPDTGKLAKQRIDQMRRAMQTAIKAERMFRKHAFERLSNVYRDRLDQQLLQWRTKAGLQHSSSHDMMGGNAWWDPSSPEYTTHNVTELQYYHDGIAQYQTTQGPTTYDYGEDKEPHGITNAISTEVRKDLRMLRADSSPRWRRRAYMDSNGMFRPFSTLPHTRKAARDDAYFMSHWRNEQNTDAILDEFDCDQGDDGAKKIHDVQGCPLDFMAQNVDFFSHEQVPPIFCQEHHLPINITTLSPFLKKGRSLRPLTDWNNEGICLTKKPDTSKGHDIEYIARDGVYPTSMSVRHPQDNYSDTHWYRAIALRGPLVLAGWGFDIDNKPVPNSAASYPSGATMKFEQDWLRKPQKWMCGPVDLRWDYKRNVWTAPTTMKIVRLELEDHLCPGQCVNAILYHDQKQYDREGDELTCVTNCTGRVGYRVKVWSNAMYPVPKGWRIMAHFDTTLNRYEMINHDPLPIVEVELTTDMICTDGTGVITDTAGECELDPCEALIGMPIDLKNHLNQPLCMPRKVLAWICGFECSEDGDPGPTLDNCATKCPTAVRAKGVILQGEFKPECIVTHLELMEFYCWGYDVSCDEEDIDIWSQGDIDLCWDWCLNLAGKGCTEPYVGSTSGYTHTHSCIIQGEVTGSTFGYTDWDTHSHSGTVSCSGLGTFSGCTDYDSHSHELEVSGDVALSGTAAFPETSVTVSGDTDNSGGGAFSATGTGTDTFEANVDVSFDDTVTVSGITDEANCSFNTNITPTYSCSCDILPVDSSGLMELNVLDLTCSVECDVTITGDTGNNTACDITVTGAAPAATCDITENTQGSIVNGTGDCAYDITCGSSTYCSGTFSCDINVDVTDILNAIGCDITIDPISATGPLCTHTHPINLSGDTTCDCTLSGGKIQIPIADLAADLECDCNITIDDFTVSGSCTHSHSFTGNGPIQLSGSFPVSGPINTDVSVSGTLSDHSHGVSASGTIPSQDVPVTVSGAISGITCDSYTHRHCMSGELEVDINCDIDTDEHTHRHEVELEFSGTLSGNIECEEDTHHHTYELPCLDVDVCLDGDFDIDIDGRFVPGACTLRVAVLNKNFWEYYWYALCICTRAIWHEAEFGPARCDLNETPDCDTNCDEITCEDPEYDCPVPTRTEYDLADGENVSWFGFAPDTTLLKLATTCSEPNVDECYVSASCTDVSTPDVDCCAGGCGTMTKSGDGFNANIISYKRTSDGHVPIDNDGDGVTGYCPDPTAAGFVEEAFMRDYQVGLFDFIDDELQDHLPDGLELVGD